MLTYLGFAVTLLLPLYFVYRAWTVPVESHAAWALHAANGLGLLGALLVIGRWDLAGGASRYVILSACAIGIAASWIRVSDRPLVPVDQWTLSWSVLLDTVAIIALFVWAGLGLWPDRPAVDLHVPLHGDDYYVAHGGGTYPINYHGLAAESQRYAVDVTQLNDWGFRASGLYPDDLRAYEIYSDSVYSPLTGTVVGAVDRFPDLTPGARQKEHPAGNHVWMRRGDLYVVLAHLKQGSVRVDSGDHVRAGQAIAVVGNTGNTSEPHLHVHAVRPTTPSPPVPDSALAHGTPVPLAFHDQFLTRNDLLPDARSRSPDPAGTNDVHAASSQK